MLFSRCFCYVIEQQLPLLASLELLACAHCVHMWMSDHAHHVNVGQGWAA